MKSQIRISLPVAFFLFVLCLFHSTLYAQASKVKRPSGKAYTNVIYLVSNHYSITSSKMGEQIQTMNFRKPSLIIDENGKDETAAQLNDNNESIDKKPAPRWGIKSVGIFSATYYLDRWGGTTQLFAFSRSLPILHNRLGIGAALYYWGYVKSPHRLPQSFAPLNVHCVLFSKTQNVSVREMQIIGLPNQQLREGGHGTYYTVGPYQDAAIFRWSLMLNAVGSAWTGSKPNFLITSLDFTGVYVATPDDATDDATSFSIPFIYRVSAGIMLVESKPQVAYNWLRSPRFFASIVVGLGGIWAVLE